MTFVSLTEGLCCHCFCLCHLLPPFNIRDFSSFPPPVSKILHHRSSWNFLSCLSCSSISVEAFRGILLFLVFSSSSAQVLWMGLSLCFLGFVFFLFFQDENCCVKPFFLVKNRHPFSYYLPAVGTCILFIPCTQSLE